MAPYTVAHLKLSMAFRETGFKYFNRRLGIYLTNSLEKAIGQGELFTAFGLAESIAEESKEAAVIKDKTPIMVVIGNPPYSVNSSNKGKWIQNLIKEYKINLNEKKINIDDDYIKFIRLAENFIEENKNGIVAMITNNSFIDGITHRQMRKHLLETFDDIYILNLHGSMKKKEKTPDGKKDENVFDIQQGVSINIFVRNKEVKDSLGKVQYADIYGKRKDKFEILDASSIESIKWSKLSYSEPYYFFIPRDLKSEEEYNKGFKIDELMEEYNSGIQSKRDKICFTFTKSELENITNDFEKENILAIRTKYHLPPDGRDWKIDWAKKDLRNGYSVKSVLYRPFDVRQTAYTGKSKGFLAYPREKTFKHFINKENIGLITVRQQSTFDFQHILATKYMIESGAISLQTKEWGYIFPLYLYSESGRKVSNLKKEIIEEMEKTVGEITPEEVIDYIYAVIYSPNYREKYKEFLKIDFPRVPYPKNLESFKKLVLFGTELRLLHLLESPKISKYITTYPNDGSNIVEKLVHKDGNVYINEEQYFGNVIEIAWKLYSGGSKPAKQ